MPEQDASPSSKMRESKLHEVDGIQVYARMDERGRPARLDAIDQDGDKIRAVADRVHRLGYGVMRLRNPRAGKVYYLFKALWVGPGEPPEDPFNRS